jgi:hypothetical protein
MNIFGARRSEIGLIPLILGLILNHGWTRIEHKETKAQRSSPDGCHANATRRKKRGVKIG